jgi:membrane protease YdiL (CAAX protease family)
MPEWLRLDKVDLDALPYVKPTMALALVFNGFVGPTVEELYFRGLLLPRMSMCGKLAPLANAVLFSVYHFFSPWENLTRIVGVTPMIYSTRKNRDIRIGMITHCSLNTLSVISTMLILLA